jgi:hypothetical protein
MRRKKQKYQSITVRISDDERKMANKLRDKYYIRISRIVGNAIRDYYKKVSNLSNEYVNRQK